MVVLAASAPSGVSFVLNKTSVSLSDDPQSIPVELKADTSQQPGRYSVGFEVTSGSLSLVDERFTIEVVPVLVLMQGVAFHPQNITVAKGTSVYWINLDSTIGCCDPGNHDVVFLSGQNASSPILKRLDSWAYTFDNVALVQHCCSIHPYMKGQVSVTD